MNMQFIKAVCTDSLARYRLIKMIKQRIGEYYVLFALVFLIALFGLISDNFLSLVTFRAIVNQLPALTVITVGMTLVLIAGCIDLSVGAVVGLCSAVTGVALISFGLPLPLAFLLGILSGALCGLFNGFISAYFLIPSFIVTLGMLEMARGLGYLTTQSQTVFIGPQIQFLSLPIKNLGLSPALLISVSIVIAAHVILTRSVFGKYIVAIGTNETAARASGISILPYRVLVLTLSGALAGLGGNFYASYLGAADPNAGIGLELSAIAAAVIGGTSLMGGRGSVLGAFAGVLIISILQNGLAQIGATEPLKRLITGGVIIAAVLFDHWRTNHR